MVLTRPHATVQIQYSLGGKTVNTLAVTIVSLKATSTIRKVKYLLLTRPTHLHRQIIDRRILFVQFRRVEIERRPVGVAPRVLPPFFASRRREVAFVGYGGREESVGIVRYRAAGDGHFDGAVGHGEADDALSGTLCGGRDI